MDDLAKAGRSAGAGFPAIALLGYVGVGGGCALLNNAIAVIGDCAGANYLATTVLGIVLVTPLAFVLHSLVTFCSPPSLQGFFRFVLGTTVGSLLSLTLMVALCGWLSMRASLAMPLATALLFVWNFFSARWAILRLWPGDPLWTRR